MRGVSVHAGMPQCRDADVGRLDRQVEAHQAFHERGVPDKRLGYECDEIRLTGDPQCIGKARYDGDDRALEPESLQCLVDWPRETSPARGSDMPGGC